jgi:predicted negative regulator of RcsB-dependent stress response
MAEHISRKDLKKDEFRDRLVHGAEAVASHQKQLWTYGIVVLLGVILVFGWRYYTQSQTAKASAALSDAMQTYEARIRGANEPLNAPDEVTYLDEKNRDADAAKKFEAVATRYRRTRPGQMARYYDALCLEVLGRDADAEKDLASLQSSSDEGLVALARFQLAQIYDRTGKGPDAVKLYQQLADNPSLFVPRPVALLALADHYSSGDPEQAAKFYKQVKTEFPDTPAAQTADQRLQLLPTKS